MATEHAFPLYLDYETIRGVNKTIRALAPPARGTPPRPDSAPHCSWKPPPRASGRPHGHCRHRSARPDHPQFRTLHFIPGASGSQPLATADFLGSPALHLKLVDQLVRRGMLARVDASDDRRRMTLRNTAKGDALTQKCPGAGAPTSGRPAQPPGSAELAALHNTLGFCRIASHPTRDQRRYKTRRGNGKEPSLREPRGVMTKLFPHAARHFNRTLVRFYEVFLSSF